MAKKRVRPAIKPFYIKNQKGKTTHIYLDIKTYEAILEDFKRLEKIKKEFKKARSKQKK